MKILLSEVNISEGKNMEKINLVKEALLEKNEVDLIDLNSDPDHNRTVFTYKGEAEKLLEATKRLASKTIELIDMREHKGSHPRMGALDVVPFIPVSNITIEEAVEIAKRFGKYLGSLGVPVYYYEDAATCPERKNLTNIRKGQYEALQEKIASGNFVPDEGPNEFNAKSGATITGVRFPLVALNVNLKTDNLDIGKEIVKAVRAATGGYQNVRAIALRIEERNLIQVSMNLVQYEKTPLHRVFETVKSEAKSYGVLVENTELVGNLPLAAIEDIIRFYLQARDFSIKQIY